MDQIADLLPRFLGPWDLAALAVFFGCLIGMTRLVEHSPENRPSTSQMMAFYRRRWMNEVPNRSNRVVDTQLLVALRNGSAFFASGTMIAIGGIAALLGQTERLVDVAEDFTGDFALTPGASQIEWEAKLLFLLALMVAAFLKFVWSHRLFGYCAILMGATPENGGAEETAAAVERAAQLNISAGRAFNRGLRVVYFGLAGLAWFLGPLALALGSLLTAAVIYRREFRSDSRKALLAGWKP
ncbi:MAG TPA: DUF599 domain-containing protein [Thermohalobaculum sp.]|nr:DUF599 domain-containing protein [Thermohalobaculum sp.]